MKTKTIELSDEQEYRKDVRDAAEGLEEDIKIRVKDGEDAGDIIHEYIDGHPRVIYTFQAKMCLVYSDNDTAYFDEFGSEGAIDDSGINWSGLAFFAFQADVLEMMDFDPYTYDPEEEEVS